MSLETKLAEVYVCTTESPDPVKDTRFFLRTLPNISVGEIRNMFGSRPFKYYQEPMSDSPIHELVAELGSKVILGEPEKVPDAEAIPQGRSGDRLTVKEEQVLKLLGAGLKRPGIAGEMGISVRAVNNHLGKVYQKLGIHNVSQAVLFAARNIA